VFDWQTQKMGNMDYTYVKTVVTDDKGMPTRRNAAKAFR
jgi:hypothetical protein